MRIAIYTGSWQNEDPARSRWLLVSEWVMQLANSLSVIQWAVAGNRAIGESGKPGNLSCMPVEGNRESIAGRWLYKRRLQKTLQHWQPDWVINFDPEMAGAIQQPQILVLHTDWQENAEAFFQSRASKRKKKMLESVQQIMVAWPWQAVWLQEHYDLPADHITYIGAGTTDHFKPAGWAHREELKQQNAGGTEYFLYAGPASDAGTILTLLKAFSAFKKRQRSSMHLVLAFTIGSPSASLQQKLDTYKYRQDLKMVTEPNMDLLARLAAGSYAVLAGASFWPGWWLTGALQAGTSIVTEHRNTPVEALGEAALYVIDWKPDVLAEAMMLLYKDEAQRSTLIAAGRQQLELNSWEKLTRQCWQALQAK